MNELWNGSSSEFGEGNAAASRATVKIKIESNPLVLGSSSGLKSQSSIQISKMGRPATAGSRLREEKIEMGKRSQLIARPQFFA